MLRMIGRLARLLFSWVAPGIGFRAVAVLIGGGLVAGVFGGWKVRDAFCDAAANSAQVQALEEKLSQRDHQLELTRDLYERDLQLATSQAERDRENQENINATPSGDPDANPVLSDDALDRVFSIK